MMAAVAIGAYPSMARCVETWVTPLLDAPETPSPALVERYQHLFHSYQRVRSELPPVWHALRQPGAGR
ncbi:hypothetical protein ACQFN5_09860 [Klebsiella sp. WOUb02]|uniref:hypothetical protein n=1 Tax=Klebsiella sp. WOUb02 TaxID=3161071 RepID=UPI003CE99DA8